MNLKQLFNKEKTKRLNTTARAASVPAAGDYDAEEPNVRLSRAFFVVMLLHVVAVGGIFAFSSLKKNNAEPLPVLETTPKLESLSGDSRLYVVTASDTLGSIASTFGLTRNDLQTANNLKDTAPLKPGDKLIIPAKSTTPAVPLNVQKLLQLSQNPQTKTPAPIKPSPATVQNTVKSVETNTAPAGKVYVVQKGDNPVLIAKRQGIKYADLLEANKITDPKKLQIGQKLVIPQK